MRRLRWVVALAVLAPVAFYGWTLAQVWRTGHHDGRRPAQAIVVLGAAQYNGRPSPALRRRLDHVVALWQAGIAPLVVVTGGKAPGDEFTEATASATYLREHGVPDASILREVHGRTSWQSLADASAILRQRQATKVVLVSDPSHAARIEGIADELGLDATVSPAPGAHPALATYGREAAVVAAAQVVGFRRLSGISSRVSAA